MKFEIYIHIPFCVKKCNYCDFLSAVSSGAERETYVDMLCREILSCPGAVKELRVSSIFFGGGTPSLLTGEQIGKIMEALRRRFVIDGDAEITLEMNPGTVDAGKLSEYRQAGINRLSIGLQSAHDEELRMLGRVHTYTEFLDAYRMAREVGFGNINIDLISAIPGQTVESWSETLREIVDLGPEHISAYSLIIEPGTPFFELYGEENGQADVKLPDEDEERQIYWRTKEILGHAGYERYEISNYARPGYGCRHNVGYWERMPYLGFGIGAASLVPEVLMEQCEAKVCGQCERGTAEECRTTGRMSRYTNPDNVEDYRKSFLAKFRGTFLSREEEMEEFMFLGLRKMAGISRAEFDRYFGIRIEEVYEEQIVRLEKLELIEEKKGNIRLTEKGIDVSNSVFVEFIF